MSITTFVAIESLTVALAAIAWMLIERVRVRRHRQHILTRLAEICEKESS